MKIAAYRLTLVLSLLLMLSFPFLVSATGAYEKEMLSTDFKATERAFYALARVNAQNATATYLRELQNDDSRTMGFLCNGCLVKCIDPPENGWILVELFNTAGVVRVQDLSFDIEAVQTVMNNYYALRDIVLSGDPKEANPNWHEVLRAGQKCTVLYLSWPYPEVYHHYYFIETNGFYGYVPIDSLSQIDRH